MAFKDRQDWEWQGIQRWGDVYTENLQIYY
jgi:hypothetical protein